jgi:hypothetical protein
VVTDLADRKVIDVPGGFYRRLDPLALRHDRTVSDLLEHAIRIHFGEEVAQARLRLIDRLARFEARLGDSDLLLEEIADQSRAQCSQQSQHA